MLLFQGSSLLFLIFRSSRSPLLFLRLDFSSLLKAPSVFFFFTWLSLMLKVLKSHVFLGVLHSGSLLFLLVHLGHDFEPSFQMHGFISVLSFLTHE